MKQNMIISVVIVVAVCLVVIFFAVGYSRMLQPVSNPVPVTPVVTPTVVVTTPTPVPTPQIDWTGYIGRGTSNIDLAKKAIILGRSQMDPVLAVQGQYAGVITTLYMAKANFTSAKNYFIQAQYDIANATVTAPQSQQDTLSKLAMALGSDATSTDLYIQSTDFGLANDWWDSNNAYNQANIRYTGNIQSTNNLLNSMNILVT